MNMSETKTYYHASQRDLPIGESLKTPTGHSGMDITSGGVVYMCDNPAACKRYGTVYEIECTEAVPYKLQLKKQGRSKKPRYTRGVFVALPEKTLIVRKLT